MIPYYFVLQMKTEGPAGQKLGTCAIYGKAGIASNGAPSSTYDVLTKHVTIYSSKSGNAQTLCSSETLIHRF